MCRTDRQQGISLSTDQFKTFIGLLPEIERVLAAKGIEVPRPQYDAKSNVSVEADDEDREEEDSTKRGEKRSKTKPNHEATSDEDEE